jgi:LDH2 family malate/lactate/ureidoglycolate dehydrogenase
MMEAGVSVDAAVLEAFCRATLRAAGGDDASAEAATRAMMHGSRLGVDSHGVRLLPHYVAVLRGGRVNSRPRMRLSGTLGAVATLDADNGHGALAAYTAMTRALGLATSHGIGAVAIRNTSHFGPAGAYAIVAAEAGFIGIAMCNADAYACLHGGAERFHGTNPIAIAVPVEGERPWLLDMATSAITYNRVQLCRSLQCALPPGAAVDSDGMGTDDPQSVAMLSPIGGAFGFKGAGLAGFVEILTSILNGMRPSSELLPMEGPDMRTPRGLGAFVMAIRPGAFLEPAAFQTGMRHYLAQLRGSRAVAGGAVMAPGDREWAEADRRAVQGIPIDGATANAFAHLAEEFGLSWPTSATQSAAS